MEWKVSNLLFNKYEVSELGDIRSIKTKKLRKKQLSKRHGRYVVSVYLLSKAYTRKVARIVAEAFVPNPLNLPEVNHINGDKTDDRAINLEWMTKPENIKHAYSNGLMKSGKLDVTKVKEIKSKILKGDKSSKIALEYGVTRNAISRIKAGKVWKDI